VPTANNYLRGSGAGVLTDFRAPCRRSDDAMRWKQIAHFAAVAWSMAHARLSNAPLLRTVPRGDALTHRNGESSCAFAHRDGTVRMASVWFIVAIGAGAGAIAFAALVIHLVRDFRRWCALIERI
jgi:hypothetical protein